MLQQRDEELVFWYYMHVCKGQRTEVNFDHEISLTRPLVGEAPPSSSRAKTYDKKEIQSWCLWYCMHFCKGWQPEVNFVHMFSLRRRYECVATLS